MDRGLLGGVLLLLVVVLYLLNRRLDRLPGAVYAMGKRERTEATAQALDAMTKDIATRAGIAVVAIERSQDAIAYTLRVQLADAEKRADIAERSASDATAMLEAASTLVRDQRQAAHETRELLDVARLHARDVATLLEVARVLNAETPPRAPERTMLPPALRAARTARTAAEHDAPAERALAGHDAPADPGLDETTDIDRKTVEMPPLPQPRNDADRDFDDDDEQTSVADRSEALTAVRGASVRRVTTAEAPTGTDGPVQLARGTRP